MLAHPNLEDFKKALFDKIKQQQAIAPGEIQQFLQFGNYNDRIKDLVLFATYSIKQMQSFDLLKVIIDTLPNAQDQNLQTFNLFFGITFSMERKISPETFLRLSEEELQHAPSINFICFMIRCGCIPLFQIAQQESWQQTNPALETRRLALTQNYYDKLIDNVTSSFINFIHSDSTTRNIENVISTVTPLLSLLAMEKKPQHVKQSTHVKCDAITVFLKYLTPKYDHNKFVVSLNVFVQRWVTDQNISFNNDPIFETIMLPMLAFYIRLVTNGENTSDSNATMPLSNGDDFLRFLNIVFPERGKNYELLFHFYFSRINPEKFSAANILSLPEYMRNLFSLACITGSVYKKIVDENDIFCNVAAELEETKNLLTATIKDFSDALKTPQFNLVTVIATISYFHLFMNLSDIINEFSTRATVFVQLVNKKPDDINKKEELLRQLNELRNTNFSNSVLISIQKLLDAIRFFDRDNYEIISSHHLLTSIMLELLGFQETNFDSRIILDALRAPEKLLYFKLDVLEQRNVVLVKEKDALVETKKEDKKKAELAYQQLNEQNDELKKQVKEKDTSNITLQKNNTKKDKEIEKLKGELTSKDQEIEALKKQLQQLAQSKNESESSLRKQLELANQQQTQQADEFKKLKIEMASLNEQLVSRETNSTPALGSEPREMTEKFREQQKYLFDQIEQYQHSCDRLQAELSAREVNPDYPINALQTSVNFLLNQVNSLKEEIIAMNNAMHFTASFTSHIDMSLYQLSSTLNTLMPVLNQTVNKASTKQNTSSTQTNYGRFLSSSSVSSSNPKHHSNSTNDGIPAPVTILKRKGK